MLAKCILAFSAITLLTAQTSSMVEVEPGVSLEVVDWGGKGTPLLFIPGLGNTAHIFDHFAPLLNSEFRVLGLTRRGFGTSSLPYAGYHAARLAQDVIEVMNAKKLEKAVLIGHSVAGSELSAVGTKYPDRCLGLVYLDAINDFAHYREGEGFLLRMGEIVSRINRVAALGGSPRTTRELIDKDLAELASHFRFIAQLQEFEMKQSPTGQGPPASLAELSKRLSSEMGGPYPESELAQGLRMDAKGRLQSIRPYLPRTDILQGLARWDMTKLKLPFLAISAHPQKVRAGFEAEAAQVYAPLTQFMEGQFEALRKAPQGKVVVVPNGHHYVFLSHQDLVLQEIRDFLRNLPAR